MDENIAILKGIGLTMYEAQAYVTLVSLISSNATEISEKSGIPRSKIYDVLKGLIQKNYIDVEDGRPLTYNVKSPVEVLSLEKNRLTTELDDTITRLTNVYENGMSQVQAPIWRIYGVDKIINQELEIITRAKHSINMRIGFLFEEEGEALVKILKKRKNLNINILASPTCCINNKTFNIIKFFKDNDIPVHKADIPFVKVLISDSKEMMHTYTKFSEDKRTVLPETAIGIWNKYEDIARNYDERFMNQLHKIQNKKKKTT
ncbi:transcriptional regulator [Methanobrevibacter gottschalkii]|uniref:Transcriptional regulator n=1 Tax=Methanobrevibacter gottschalkii TaxID=190974 RepID=A0A1H7M0W0_9EURY|nr:helix-turn-helix domain-containing protein [Methanobrevibacter gottschalkii]MCQ2971132.1 TrmB family transcriptional regulator [archaeon]SEL04863.1 transcriptional regulator [Methanobrevibacter gottschalkii]